MAETLGFLSSLIAVVELTGKVVSLCLKYSNKVKNARHDIERLQRAASELSAILKQVQSVFNGPNGEKFEVSRRLNSEIKDSLELLNKLKTKLEPQESHKATNLWKIRALKWPFTSIEVEAIVNDLEKHKNLISLALQVDQAYVTLYNVLVE